HDERHTGRRERVHCRERACHRQVCRDRDDPVGRARHQHANAVRNPHGGLTMQSRGSCLSAGVFGMRGFTVVEVLVAVAISLLLLAGVMALFANSRLSYESNDRLARIQENGRFALALITRDLRAAGYWGCAKRTASKPLTSVLNNPTTLLHNFAVPVQGFNASGAGWTPALID